MSSIPPSSQAGDNQAAAEDTLDRAIRMARTRPLTLQPLLSSFGPLFLAVVSVAYWLQQQWDGGNTILLPVARLAEAFGVEPIQISRCTSIATQRGLLEPEEGRKWRPGRGKRWTFRLDAPGFTAPAEEAEG